MYLKTDWKLINNDEQWLFGGGSTVWLYTLLSRGCSLVKAMTVASINTWLL